VVWVDPLNLEFLNGLNGLNNSETIERFEPGGERARGVVERTQQNPYGLVVSSVEQTEIPSARSQQLGNLFFTIGKQRSFGVH
jgi:hypothetical protein